MRVGAYAMNFRRDRDVTQSEQQPHNIPYNKCHQKDCSNCQRNDTTIPVNQQGQNSGSRQFLGGGDSFISKFNDKV